jgi:hypothetical protein
MKVIQIPGQPAQWLRANKEDKNQTEVIDIPVVFSFLPNGMPVTVIGYQLDDEDKARIMAGENIYVMIWGHEIPPHSAQVGNPFVLPDEDTLSAQIRKVKDDIAALNALRDQEVGGKPDLAKVTSLNAELKAAYEELADLLVKQRQQQNK